MMLLTCDVKCCLSTASKQRLDVRHVVPGVTLALIVFLSELFIHLFLADVDTRLQVAHAGGRVLDVLVHLLSGTDPLATALDADLYSWRGAASQSHWTTFDDVVDLVWFDDEHWCFRMRRLLKTAPHRRQQKQSYTENNS